MHTRHNQRRILTASRAVLEAAERRAYWSNTPLLG